MTAEHTVTDEAERADLRKRVLDSIAEDGIDSIRLVLVDLHGVPRAKQVSAARFERTTLRGHSWALPLLACDLWEDMAVEETGLGADIGFGNGIVMPDLRTFTRLPWTRSSAMVMTDAFDKAGVEQPSPRQVLARVLRRAEAAGYRPVFGSELEFYVYRPELGDHGFDAVFTRQAWFSAHALGLTQQFVDTLGDCVRRMGLPVYEIFSEHGSGQFEINLEPGVGMDAIDDMVALKIAIKEVAMSLGLRATFMARPTNLWETPPSGYHLHQTLHHAGGGNAFHDADAPHTLSDVCRRYVGGQLAHAAGMTGIAAPTVTAYTRYIPGTWGPVRAAWAVDNRTALIRALPNEDNTHVENRLGSSDANPYLLAAANVAAGLDGIEKGTDPGEPSTGVLFEDPRFQHLPTSLIDGVNAYAADAGLTSALGEDFTRIYTGLLRRDWQRYMEHVSDWEIKEYRDLL